MTRLDLITGFLGAGKTTLIRRYAALARAHGETIAVVENEFGAAGVDTAFLSEDGLDVHQLVGGCICCTQKVGLHDLILQLAGHCDRLIVEPSGIFNMDDFLDIAYSPRVRKLCTPGAAILVVDPLLPLTDDEKIREMTRSQLCGCKSVYFSKTQCCPGARVLEAQERLEALAPSPEHHYFTTPIDALTYEELERMRAPGYGSGAHRRVREDHSALFASTSFAPPVISRERLEAALHRLMKGECGTVLRIKGFVRDSAGECLEINCTADAFCLRPGTGHATMLNIIGEGLNRRAIRALFSGD